MPNIFESIGRTTGLADSSSNLADMVLKMRQQNVNEAVAQSNIESGKMGMEVQKEQLRAAQFEQKQKEDAVARDKKLVPLSILGISNDPIFPMLKKKAESLGYINKEPNTGIESISVENLKNMKNISDIDYAFGKQIKLIQYQSLDDEINKIQSELSGVGADGKKVKLKPEDVQAKQTRLKSIVNEMDNTRKHLDFLDEKIRQTQSEEEIKHKNKMIENEQEAMLKNKYPSTSGEGVKIGAEWERLQSKISKVGLKGLTTNEREMLKFRMKQDAGSNQKNIGIIAARMATNDPRLAGSRPKEQKVKIMQEYMDLISEVLIPKEDINPENTLDHPLSGASDNTSIEELLNIIEGK